MIYCELRRLVSIYIRCEQTTDLINGGGGGGDTSGAKAEKMQHSMTETVFFQASRPSRRI